MEATTPVPAMKYNRLLPYWAVLQTDLRQTVRSWVFRLWVIMMALVAGGYLIYEYGARNEGGVLRNSALELRDMFRYVALGSLALIAVIAVGSISSERATVADSVLSRGISRYQYFLAKWHSRTVAVLATFSVMSFMVVAGHALLVGKTGDETDVTTRGAMAATAAVGAALMVLVAIGVTVGALSNGTVMGITAFWLLLYGGMLASSLLPEPYPSPGRMMDRLQIILRGNYDDGLLWRYIGGSLMVTGAAATVGAIGFNRKDV
jgi:ABC-type transport system involved in multi-copper enzyme maturation permease subunit